MPVTSSSYSNNKRNYSTPGSLGFHIRSQGTIDFNQTSLLRNGASPVGSGVYGNGSYRVGQVGLIQYNGNLHGYSNGFHYGSGHVNGSMVSASLPSNVEQTVQRAISEGYSNGHGGLVQNGSMVGASLPSNLAQPVQQEIPTNRSFPSSMIRNMDDPNPIGHQEFPRISRLRYDGKTGGISMLPWPVPVDDGVDLLNSYLEGDNEVMHNTATTQGMQGDGADGQISASQPQDFTDLLVWESTDENGIVDTSGGDGTDGQISASQPQDFTDLLRWESTDGNGTTDTSGGSGVVADGMWTVS